MMVEPTGISEKIRAPGSNPIWGSDFFRDPSWFYHHFISHVNNYLINNNHLIIIIIVIIVIIIIITY